MRFKGSQKIMTWRESVLEAIRRYSKRHSTRSIERQRLINEELAQIATDTQTGGETPGQTLSRVLQELRDDGILYFISNGNYLLADSPFHVESEDLPDDAIDFAIRNNKLAMGIVPTADSAAITRQRKGQDRVRAFVLDNYDHRCAFCDVDENRMLIASHISGWADDPEGRGDLTNVMCLCRFHDALFEYGYFSLSNDYNILKRNDVFTSTISLLLDRTVEIRLPPTFRPGSKYLTKHRIRNGFPN